MADGPEPPTASVLIPQPRDPVLTAEGLYTHSLSHIRGHTGAPHTLMPYANTHRHPLITTHTDSNTHSHTQHTQSHTHTNTHRHPHTLTTLIN